MLPQNPMLAMILNTNPTDAVSLEEKKYNIPQLIAPKYANARRKPFLLPDTSAIPERMGDINATTRKLKDRQ
jgi:hypothetical protein